MNIRILDSWLREYLKTKATPKQIADALSLTSVSVERVEKFSNDYVYDIEITTNRPDLMSVVGIAREAAAVLPQFGRNATFVPLRFDPPKEKPKELKMIKIINDPKLVNRICAVILEVKLKESPDYMKQRLETCGIRSLNNLIDVTNYVMREIGHPTHVFDYDRLATKKIIIRESKKEEIIITLDEKEHKLPGGDIVADDGTGKIVDLLGVMGTANSVVTNQTKRILYFIDNNEPYHIRKTSMSLGIRTEAAVLNEKGIDPELAYQALLRGISIFKDVADAKLLSDVIDIYPNKPKKKKITTSIEKINKVIGIEIPVRTIVDILSKLGFETKVIHDKIEVTVPSAREKDVIIVEDIIEEIARVYGYHKLPNLLPPFEKAETLNLSHNEFFWESRVKHALKYWGFTEGYTYSMVSADLYEGPLTDAITIQNPLNEELVYMRRTLVPSLLHVARENKNKEQLKIFEIANVYVKKTKSLPDEIMTLAGVIKKPKLSFYEVKGIIQQLLHDLGIQNVEFKKRSAGGLGAEVYINSSVIARSEKDPSLRFHSDDASSERAGQAPQSQNYIGDIELLEEDIIDFEFNFEKITQHAMLKRAYKPVSRFPPIIEDVSIIINPSITYRQIVLLIKKQSNLIVEISLLDMYQNKKTFRIKYQNPEKNLTNEDIAPIREKIYKALEKELEAKIV